jgi:hypothetical protein
MSPIRRTATKPLMGRDSDFSEVYFVKAGHKYAFRYDESDERHLVCALLDAALNPRLNLDLEDVRKLVSVLGLGSFIQPASGV